jgi:hypothetical protein
MWIFTRTGFISAVETKIGSDTLAVRARNKEHLKQLSSYAQVEIANSPFGDYPYRVFVTKTDFAGFLASQVFEIDYTNFKSKIATVRQYEYLDALHDVWTTMHKVEDAEARTNTPTWVSEKPSDAPQGGLND